MNEKQKKRLNIAKEYATSKGGTCLSEEYVNSKTKLTWKCCNPNHEKWEALFDNTINKKSWCPNCAGKFSKEEGLSRAKYYAESKGGNCLSDSYISAKKHLLWECSNGHRWESTFNSNNPTWCPTCWETIRGKSNLNKSGLEIAKQYAENKGGRCLSESYTYAKDKLLWECENNHQWLATYSKVVNTGRWCPQCSVYYYKEDKIRNLLDYLLDTKFEKVRPKWNINPKTKKLLELDGYSEELGIAFEFQGMHHYHIGNFNNTEEDLEEIKLKDKAKKENCINNNVKLIIIDDVFKLSEKDKILKYITDILIKNSIKIRQSINKKNINYIFSNQTNNQAKYLEKAKKLAISNGGQCLSTEYINAKNKMTWKCSNPKHESWEAIYDSVRRGSWCMKCNLEKNQEHNKNPNGLILAKEYAKSKMGECLSDKYINAKSKLIWKCCIPEHAIWEAPYDRVVLNKTWCPRCAGKISKEEGLEIAKNYAIFKNGKCLSDKYIGAKHKLLWSCEFGHTWKATYNSVTYNNSWCPNCSGRLPKEEKLKMAQQYAISKNGECLSTEYINNHIKMIWKCLNSNHQPWQSDYEHTVNRKRWCPECAKENRKKK